MNAVALLVCASLWMSSVGCSSIRRSVQFEKADAIVIPYEEGWAGRPVVKGSINGVEGKFLIDTGATDPILTMRAVRECGLAVSPVTRRQGFVGDEIPREFRTVDSDVKVELEKAIITWGHPPVVVGVGSELWFGIIDYRTLKASHAVINVKDKTLTISP